MGRSKKIQFNVKKKSEPSCNKAICKLSRETFKMKSVNHQNIQFLGNFERFGIKLKFCRLINLICTFDATETRQAF
jgi:hypothetical protein